MEEERKKWNMENLEKAMEESKDEFIDLEKQLCLLIVKFCLRALKTFQKSKSETLNPLQITQIIERELEHVRNDLSRPGFVGATIRKTELEYAKLQENSL